MLYAVNDNLVGGQHGSVQVNQGDFGNGNFHSSIFPIAFNCSSEGKP
jgi:hypothetical protein